ncbi:competence type IV pilus major pilin ComGC [Lentibacillus salicampi]|uniref:ComG operon protein 3 n=1 Tax=Lentibacillus salicampi TaxID=175306 RepID=A0A4Y9AED3_9BACI|nr:competence type IV pilus major pilin ComGC [Lentibacillus salicampi]TFJ93682.1 prepilin-type N-terminal cleavage/methylation domain-containing protein [Lentibacillus salicampi]
MFKNQRGFTLIEMLIVLMIISVLILLIIPNLSSKSEEVNDKGCEALVSMVQAQADAYYIAKKEYPSLDELESEGYITEDQTTCPDDSPLIIDDQSVSKGE